MQFISFKYIYIVAQPIARTFYTCKTKTLYQLDNSPLPLAQHLTTTVLFSVPVNWATLGTPCKWNHTVFVL